MLESYINAFIFIVVSIAVIIVLTFIKRVKQFTLDIFGGSIDKIELGGIIFTSLFIYMIIKEGNREHEWHYYNELYIFFTAGAAMTGLGLGKVLDTIKDIKTNNTKTNEQ